MFVYIVTKEANVDVIIDDEGHHNCQMYTFTQRYGQCQKRRTIIFYFIVSTHIFVRPKLWFSCSCNQVSARVLHFMSTLLIDKIS